MAKSISASDLFHRVAFDKRASLDNRDGNTVGAWQECFQCRARYIHLRGGESVMAGRLQGQHAQIISVRSSALSRSVNADWRIRDVRSGVTYNIRDVTPSDDRIWLDFLCQGGVADG